MVLISALRICALGQYSKYMYKIMYKKIMYKNVSIISLLKPLEHKKGWWQLWCQQWMELCHVT